MCPSTGTRFIRKDAGYITDPNSDSGNPPADEVGDDQLPLFPQSKHLLGIWIDGLHDNPICRDMESLTIFTFSSELTGCGGCIIIPKGGTIVFSRFLLV